MFLHWPHVMIAAERSYHQLACLLIYHQTKVLSECFTEYIIKFQFDNFFEHHLLVV